MKINAFFNSMGVFLASRMIDIFFLLGLGVLVYAFFRWSIDIGFFTLGISLIVVSIIMLRERGE